MITGRKFMQMLLLGGDLAVFVFSLWVTLSIRYFAIPSWASFIDLIRPFSLLFVLWILIFILAGLYNKRTFIARRAIPDRIVKVQALNITLAALFFFLIPVFGVAPKTILVIYLVVSLVLVLAWRLSLFPFLSQSTWRPRAVIIGSGDEVKALAQELSVHNHYSIVCHATIDPHGLSPEKLSRCLSDYRREGISNIIVDAQDSSVSPLLPILYKMVFEEHAFELTPLVAVYEDVFERVPISLLRYDWMFAHAMRRTSFSYMMLKRIVDIVGGTVMGAITLAVIPFVWAALRLEGHGTLFITQERAGMYGSRMRVYKFRTMRFNDHGVWKGENANAVTRVGAVLRQISLDEFPQFINILRGELSLVGPRNDIVALGDRLAQALPYYAVRYLVKPGITGWAQVNQQYEQGNISPQSINETKTRLAYDFYYIKHRSFMLDIVISLRTLKRMVFRVSAW